MDTRRLKTSLLACLGMTLFVVAPALLLPTSGRGQGGSTVGPTKPVEIVNTASNPVPTLAQGVTQVAGSVSVANTPGVNVLNTPDVNVTNALTLDPASTVQISNPPGNPVPVSVQGQPVRRYVQATGSLPENNAGNSTVVLYTVPAGKRLVIEYFSGFTRGDEAMFLLTTTVGGVQARHYIPRPAEGVIENARFVRIYADAGTDVVLSAVTPASTLQNEATITGYIEDAP